MSTPVQRQYQQLKSENPEALLFFQLGDFYELFYEDAVVGSRVLGLTLTARHRGTESEMPMCGMPIRSVEPYIEQLIELGYRVAVADQYQEEDGKIGRKVTRVISSGATVDDGLLIPDENTYIVAIAVEKTSNGDHYGLALADLSTGEFRTAFFLDEISFFDELWKINPRELLLPTDLYTDKEWCQKLPPCLQTPRKKLSRDNSENILKNHFRLQNIDKFGLNQLDILLQVSAVVLEFLVVTQKTDLSHIQTLRRYSTNNYMPIDAQTMRHLEIFNPIDQEQKKATLFSVFEKPLTPMGSRKLRQYLAAPLLCIDTIQGRHQLVRVLKNNFETQQGISQSLKKICDLERVLTRIVMKRCNARDLVFLRQSLQVFPNLKYHCESVGDLQLKKLAPHFDDFDVLTQTLEKAFIDTPPVEITGGGMFQDGYDDVLDEYRLLKRSADNWLENFLNTQKNKSGIDKLKMKFSKTFGFCLEAPTSAAKKAPADWTRRQTLVNAERFTTPELAAFESRILNAESDTFAREHELFHQLRELVVAQTARIQKASQIIAKIDALLSFARTAERWQWNEPLIRNQSDIEHKPYLYIQGGRHPVVEKISTQVFIDNDLVMNHENQFHLITGPNMAGKSTFLRQNALIILLAQIGSFVPAVSCEITLFDRIFTRVGSSDNLAGGKSTFMVEMTETAKILNAATEKSFIILDEIGRGTSTFDGISLAWSIAEYLHNNTKALTIFATHYHEMIECTELLPYGKNFHVSVQQKADQIIFLRKILPGGVSDSFGIEVAISAGFPDSVIKRSREVLLRLETLEDASPQQPLFTFSASPVSSQKKIDLPKKTQKEVLLFEKIKKLELDVMTPREALEALYQIKDLSKNDNIF